VFTTRCASTTPSQKGSIAFVAGDLKVPKTIDARSDYATKKVRIRMAQANRAQHRLAAYFSVSPDVFFLRSNSRCNMIAIVANPPAT
jgi:hypothetical protein